MPTGWILIPSWLWTSKILRPLSFFELTSGFTLQGATGFSCCTTQHVALCLALATRTNEANEARKASQSRSLRSKSLKKRPGARIHDKTMCHQLFQLLLQGKSMGCYWNAPPVCKIASHTTFVIMQHSVYVCLLSWKPTWGKKKGFHVSTRMLKFMSRISAMLVLACAGEFWYFRALFGATCHINIEPHKLPFSAQPTVPCSRHFSLWPSRCKPVSPD